MTKLPLVLLAVTVSAQSSVVPFVGCELTGQQIRPAPPNGSMEIANLTPAAAQKLAYYSNVCDGRNIGVLAPRGWHCFGIIASSGNTLFITPQPLTYKDIRRDQSHVLATEPAVHISWQIGSGMGRFVVGEVIARAFPGRQAFLANHASDYGHSYTVAPYPADRMKYRESNVVAFTTPANTEGLGTVFGLDPGPSPIDGVAILEGPTPDLLLCTVRRPQEIRTLSQSVINHVIAQRARMVSGWLR